MPRRPSPESLYEPPRLSEREQQVLWVVVRDYIRGAEPVPSRRVAERSSLGLSPASMRTVMARLEELGLLSHPHTSAGRVPTENGFRCYLESILDIRELAERTASVVEEAFAEVGGSLPDAMRATSRALSRLTRQAAVAVGPRFDDLVVERVDLVRLAGRSIIVIVVSQEGILHQRNVLLEEAIDQIDLDRAAGRINERLRGRPVRTIRGRILEEIRRDKGAFDRLMQRAVAACEAALSTGLSEVVVEGSARLLEAEEFRRDVGRMRALWRAIEDRSLLLKILERAGDADGVRIQMGGRGDLVEFGGLSFVTSAMGGPGGPEGLVGVLGPIRMDYDRVVPLVGYASKLISRRMREAVVSSPGPRAVPQS